MSMFTALILQAAHSLSDARMEPAARRQDAGSATIWIRAKCRCPRREVRSPTGRPTAALACQTHRAERVGVIAVGRSMRVFSLLRRKARARRVDDEALLKYRSTDSIPLAAARAGFSAATDQQADHACARPRRGGRREPAHPPRASPRGSRHRLQSDESGGSKQDDEEAGADGAHQAPAQILYPTPRTVSMKSGASLAGRGCTSPQTRIMATMQGCRRGIAGRAYIPQHM
jgi:hypothetical protein